jgi:hypothetical protein
MTVSSVDFLLRNDVGRRCTATSCYPFIEDSVLASDDTLQVLDRFLDYANSNIHIHNTQ